MSTTSPTLGRPSGAKGEETRQRILAAAMRCVAELGYSRASIREIARMAGITSGSLYHYFPNKSDLMTAAFLEISEVSIPRLAGAADRVHGVVDKLMAVFDEGGRLMRDHPYAAAFDRAIRAEAAEHLHLGESSDSIFAALRGVVADIVEQASREGELSAEVDIDSAVNVIHAILLGLHEHAVSAALEEYQATVRALKLLLQGTLFHSA